MSNLFKSNTVKQLLLFVSVMLSSIAHSQWDVGDYVDEDGIETGEIFLYQDALGRFTKGRKKNKLCGYFIQHDLLEKTFAITIYPFNKSEEEVWKYDTFQWTIIKTPSGELSPIEAFCIDGMIYFDGIEYEQFMNTFKEDGTYTMTMNHSLDRTKTNYEFTFKK